MEWVHSKMGCPGSFKKVLKEQVVYSPGQLPVQVLRYGLYIVCDSCEGAYMDIAFERKLKDKIAMDLLDKKEDLTYQEKRFLRFYYLALEWVKNEDRS